MLLPKAGFLLNVRSGFSGIVIFVRGSELGIVKARKRAPLIPADAGIQALMQIEVQK
jgi:hypothetical protein